MNCYQLCLTSQVPLKAGEQHCLYCYGHGYKPVPEDETICAGAKRCSNCDGTGKTTRGNPTTLHRTLLPLKKE